MAAPVISVRERDGIYKVAAGFEVPESTALVHDVLTTMQGSHRMGSRSASADR